MNGDSSYRELELRYGISRSTMQRWVKGGEAGEAVERGDEATGEAKRAAEPSAGTVGELSESEAAVVEIKRLKRELHKAELHAELLNAMIEIAKDELGIDIRKKHGPRR